MAPLADTYLSLLQEGQVWSKITVVMAQFIVHRDESEKKAGSRRVNEGGYSSFWVPFAIVIAGALIASAVIFKDRLSPATGGVKGASVSDVAPAALIQPSAAPASRPAVKIEIPVADSPFLGEASASVTVVEFTDFQCPACAAFFGGVLPQLQADYINKGLIKYVVKHFPLRNIHPNAESSAEAAACADEQKAFAKYHDLLFSKQNEWSSLSDPTEKLVGYAQQLGLNSAAFRSCLTGGRTKDLVEKDFQLGVSIGVSGTPTVYVNGVSAGAPGYIPTFGQVKELIDQNLR